MSNVPDELRYTAEHEWVRTEGDLVVVGITDHAQASLGDVVFLDLPDAGKALAAGKAFGVVESVKAASDLFAPLDGEVVEVNSALVSTPDVVNKDPYGGAWMIKMKPKEAGAAATLLDAAGYRAVLAKIAK